MAEAGSLYDISLQLKEQNEGSKDQTVILQQIATSLAGPSASQQAEAEQEKKIPAEGGGGGGMGGGGLKGIGKIFKKLMGFVNMIKKGILLLLLPAILMFLNSPFFQKALSFIKDTLMPALKAVWEWLKTLFTDPMQALKDLWNGILGGAADIGAFLWEKGIKPFWDWLVGVFKGMDWAALWKGMISGAATIGEWIWNKALKPFWTWIKEIFTGMDWSALWSGMISGAATIGEWIWNKALKPFWTWIKNIFTGMDWSQLWKDMLAGATSIGGWIWDKALKPFWTWITGVFKTTDWGALWKGLWGAVTSIGAWIWDKAIKPFWTWIKNIFSFKSADAEDEDSKKGVLGFITDLVVGIWKWFKGLFDFSTVESSFASILNLITLVPNIILGLVQGVWKWFKGLFGWEEAKTDEAAVDTKPGGIGGMLLTLVKGVWSWFKGLFGWGKDTDKKPAESEDSKKGILGFLSSLVSGVWSWFKGLFSWGTDGTGVKPAEDDDSKKGIGGFLKGLVDGIWEWFKGLFDFSSGSAAMISIAKLVFLPYTALFDLVDNVWKWFKGLFGFSSEEAEKDPRSGSEKVIDFVVALPGKIWAWLKKTVLGWFGIEKEGDTLVATVDEGDKPEPGWISKLFASIFPYWLLHPIDWAMQKLGLKDAEGKLTESGDKFKDLVIAEGGIGAAIGKIFSQIFPEWITSPIVWIKKKIGLTQEGKDTTGGWKFPGLPSINDIKEFLPMWLTNPFGYFKNLFKGSEGGAKKDEIQEEIDKQQEMIDAGDDYDWKLRSRKGIIEGLQKEMDAIPKAAKGGLLGAGALSIVGEKGPEFFIPKSRGTVIPSDVSQTASLLAMGAGGGGGGGAVTNVSINAPSTATTTAVSTVNESLTGASDPYTAIAGAFG